MTSTGADVLADQYAFRTRLVEAVANDLLGPSAEHESLRDAPLTQYICGILYPQAHPADHESATLDPSQDIDVAEESDEVSLADPPVALANVRYPSSIGLTFAVDSQLTRSVRVTVACARYEPDAGEDHQPSKTPGRGRRRGAGVSQQKWRRIPIAADGIEIDVTTACETRTDVAAGLVVYAHVRRPSPDGSTAVTVALINTNTSRPGEMRDGLSFFQPRIEVDAPTATQPAFVDRIRLGRQTADEDLRLYRLLYRHAAAFAIGHGCSAGWELTEDSVCERVYTSVLPSFDLALSDSNPAIRGQFLEAAFLETASLEQLVAVLSELPMGYESWIARQRADLERLPEGLRDIANTNVASCERAAARMRRGIEVLRASPPALEAFRLANKAMSAQRRRSTWIRAGRPASGPDEAEGLVWRPFQIAFFLICLEGLVDDRSADRDVLDLLWFPTGGGKTEAYLALIAFTLFLRRLRDAHGGGIGCLMRYTLRLLTIQQFERASALICACEWIRSKRDDLGSESISIGLWVGQDSTPNTLQQARISLDRLRTTPTLEKANPVQLHRCPWCGTPLDHTNYFIAADRKKLVIACLNDSCMFRDGLPVFVVDEDIYRYRPGLLIATVDKFASLPWRDEAATLFNLTEAGDHPPELIIQDELHLISGPLGSLTGLYETVIDLVCAPAKSRPKLIASTATIRRAAEQGRGLFDRTVSQFPPPGLDARDSYFATEAPRDQKGTRLYLGVMAPGTSQTTLLIRAYAALLQRAANIEGSSKVKDPYWTLIGYFNSLRVLAGARMQVQDDVEDRIDFLAAPEAGRVIQNRIELTSREASGDIPRHLQEMAVELPDARALDVILATNMISVGVDVDRLGLMVIMGQPQMTSEYIQASSRVGRKFPGLVVTLFNAARSRDRSHYESFVPYHAALYRQVESTSVTPFSSRARDRGLHAVLIALARLMIPALRSNQSASKVNTEDTSLRKIIDMIVQRIARVSPDEGKAARAQLDAILQAWKARAEITPTLVYRDDKDISRSVLVDASEDDVIDDALPTLWSLREVDKSSNLYVVM